VNKAGESAATLAARAMDLVGADPLQAQRTASEAITKSRPEKDPAARSTALRALGLARRTTGDLDAAVAALRSAVATAQRAGLPAPAAEGRMSLAFVLLDRGSTAAALRQADRAATTLRGRPAARLLAQRGLILQRVGRLEDALDAFRRALPVLRRGGDDLWEARLRNNRGILHAYAGRLPAATSDLRRAKELFTSLGQTLRAAGATGNLGFVAARAGDLPAALAAYDITEAAYVAAGLPAPELLLDRAELLLAAGLADEANASAAAAVILTTELGADTNLAEARLLQAKAALALGDHAQATEQAERAAAMFRRQRRRGWALVAGFVALRALAESGAAGPHEVATGRRLADALAAAGWIDLALDVRLITARAALASSRPRIAQTQLRAASAARRRGPVDVRVRAWHAEALLRAETGSRRTVNAALDAGLRALDRHRAGLGATELRVHAATHGQELIALGLRLAVDAADAARVLEWTERWRAWTLRLPPVRPPQDGELADLLIQLRRVSAELEARLLDQRPGGPGLRREQTRLEEAIRARARQVPGDRHSGPPSPLGLHALAQRLRSRALLAFATVRDAVYVVALVDGRATLHHLGDAVEAAADLDVVHFALRRLAGGTATVRSRTAALAAARAGAARLDARLLGPVSDRIVGRALVVIPTAALHGVPWNLLPTAAGRPITVAPSATTWAGAVARPPPDPGGSGVLVCGPGLTAAQGEIAALAAAHPSAVCLTGAQATVQAVSAAMDGAHWAHLATHGRLRTDNPLFSSLEVADGRLTVYDLELLQQAPRLVVLSACQSGVGAARAGEETLGLATALLALGTRTLVATMLPVSDEATAELMLAVHARLAGRSVAEALAEAQTATSDTPEGLAAAGAFSCLGAG